MLSCAGSIVQVHRGCPLWWVALAANRCRPSKAALRGATTRNRSHGRPRSRKASDAASTAAAGGAHPVSATPHPGRAAAPCRPLSGRHSGARPPMARAWRRGQGRPRPPRTATAPRSSDRGTMMRRQAGADCHCRRRLGRRPRPTARCARRYSRGRWPSRWSSASRRTGKRTSGMASVHTSCRSPTRPRACLATETTCSLEARNSSLPRGRSRSLPRLRPPRWPTVKAVAPAAAVWG